MKWFGIGVAGLVLVLAGLMIAVPLLVDPNDYKESLVTIVHERTGRELSIPGKIDLSVSMKLKVVFGLGQISLANASAGQGFPEQNFAAAEQARIELALWPLLTSRRLEIKSLILDGVRINLHRSKDGSNNWQDLMTSEEPPSSAKKKAEAPGLSALEVGLIRLTNISVDLVDQQAGRHLTLKEVAVTAGPISSGSSFPLTIGGGLDLEEQGVRSMIRLDVEGDLTLFLAEQRFLLTGFQLRSRLQRPGLPEGGLELQGRATAEIDLLKQRVTVDDLKMSLGQIEMRGSFRLEDFTTLKIESVLVVQPFSPRSFAMDLGLEVPAFQADDALSRFGAELKAQGDRQRLEISPLVITLDQSTLKGRAALLGLGTQPRYEVELHGDRLDLDRYAVKPAAGVVSAGKSKPEQGLAKPTEEPGAGGPLIPVALLRQLKLGADLRLDSLKGGGAELSQVVIHATVADGRLQVKPLDAMLYGGTLHVEAEVDARTDNPRVSAQKGLKGVNLGDLAQAMTGKDEFSGTLSLDAAVTSHGVTRDQLVSQANGKISLACTDGEVKKLKVLKVIRTARALYRGEAMPTVADEEATGFARLTATGVIQNGVVFNEDLQATSDLMAVNGHGTVDLVNEHLDYQLDIRIARGLNRNDTTGLTEFSGRVIPYRIAGPFSDLKQSAAVADLLKGEVKNLLMKELGRKLDPKKGAAEDEAPNLLQQGLKGLFGR